MRTLFAKIFLSFWLALVLAGAAVYVIATSHGWEPHASQHPAVGATWLRLARTMLVEAEERGGTPALRAKLTQLQDDVGAELRLLGSTDGAGVNPRLRSLAEDARSSGRLEIGFLRRSGMYAVPLHPGDDRILVAAVPRLKHLHDRALPLGVTFFSSLLVCFVLARTLTAPLGDVQAAARELAKGNLAARAGGRAASRDDEIAELARDFDSMAAHIEALRSKERRFLQDASHELRSPLARIGVALGVARQDETRLGPMLSRLELESERLAAIVDDLLELLRTQETGVLPGKEIDLDELIENVAEDARFEFSLGPRDLDVTVATPCRMQGHSSLLKRAIENVVRNALFYSNDEDPVSVTLERRAHEAVVTVRDKGEGVPEAELASLFKPFFRVDDSRQRRSGGTGLGLAITEAAVRSHGGTVGAQNLPGGGLEVTLRLPFRSP